MNAPRIATTADVPALTRLINTAYKVESFFVKGDRTNDRDVLASVLAPTSDFLLLDGPDSSGVVATVFVDIRESGGYFGLLSVDPDAQGQGHGRRLVEDAEAYCRSAGCAVLDITVVNLRTELPAFYAKFGFREVGSVPFPSPKKLSQPAHLVVMRKTLA